MGNRINQQSQPVVPRTGKTAIYCRVAGTRLSGFGEIAAQRDKLRSFAAQQGLEVCMEYSDDGYSGNNLDRPAFLQMEADIGLGKIDTVIVSRTDRIVRDMFLMGEWISGAKAKGVHLIALDGSHELPFSMSKLLESLRTERK